MELREYIEVIKKRAWILILLVVIGVSTSGFFSFFVMDKVYETHTTLILSKQKGEVDYVDVLLIRNLVQTYSQVAKSTRVLERVSENLHYNISADELKSKITVTSVDNTEVIRINVQDTDKKLAVSIANNTANIFMEEIITLMNMENVQVLDKAQLPGNPVKPKPKFIITTAFFTALMAGLGIIFLIEYLDDTIKTPFDIQKHIGLPILGVIPNIESK